MAVRIVKHAFEIIHLLTDKNPIQVKPGTDLSSSSDQMYDVTCIGSGKLGERRLLSNAGFL